MYCVLVNLSEGLLNAGKPKAGMLRKHLGKRCIGKPSISSIYLVNIRDNVLYQGKTRGK